MKIKLAFSTPRVLLGIAGVFAGTLPLGASTLLDLTTTGASASGTAALGGTFLVQQISPQTTGTGVIEPFLRVQGNDTQQGFNTDIGSPPYETKAGSWTHTLLLSDIPIVTVGSTAYRQFLLDINQNRGGDNEFLSLNQIQFFQSSVDLGTVSRTLIDETTTNPSQISFVGGTEVFRMNNAAAALNNEIMLNFLLNPGSGAGDMFLYVPSSLFGQNLSLVTLYTQFGAPPGASGSNDGFEEWAVLKASTSVPDGGSTIALLGGALILLAGVARRGVFLGLV